MLTKQQLWCKILDVVTHAKETVQKFLLIQPFSTAFHHETQQCLPPNNESRVWQQLEQITYQITEKAITVEATFHSWASNTLLSATVIMNMCCHRLVLSSIQLSSQWHARHTTISCRSVRSISSSFAASSKHPVRSVQTFDPFLTGWLPDELDIDNCDEMFVLFRHKVSSHTSKCWLNLSWSD